MNLLDVIIKEFALKNDAQLAKKLGVKPSRISKMRHGTLPVNDMFILRVYDNTGWSIERIREEIKKGEESLL
jgi:plasmid maintenance system antidote protein VapI